MNICEQIKSLRLIGNVTCVKYHGTQIFSLQERLKKLGFYGLSDSFWANIDKNRAIKLLTNSICYHLDSDEKLFDEIEVDFIVTSYVHSFPNDCVFKTNYNGGFECISNSFLDIAVVIEYDDGVLGFVCVEDNQSL